MITGYSNTISVTTLAPSLLLDLYPSAAAAYSVRLLRSAYTGSAIRVRRSSDNAESDIGFSGANLDTTSLTSFCGAGSGFVTTWYDQSGGGNNLTQTTAANQPQIVSSGSVIVEGSKPTLQLDGSDWMKNNVNSVVRLDLRTQFVVYRNTTSTDYGGIISFAPSTGSDYDTNTSNINLGGSPQNILVDNTGTSFFATSINGTRPTPYNLTTLYNDGTTFGLQSNNGTFTTNTSTFNNNSFQSGNIYIGTRFFASNPSSPNYTFIGKMQEIVLYNGSAQNTNISQINTNINDYYGIY